MFDVGSPNGRYFLSRNIQSFAFAHWQQELDLQRMMFPMAGGARRLQRAPSMLVVYHSVTCQVGTTTGPQHGLVLTACSGSCLLHLAIGCEPSRARHTGSLLLEAGPIAVDRALHCAWLTIFQGIVEAWQVHCMQQDKCTPEVGSSMEISTSGPVWSFCTQLQ
jgi:hypothetical protein